MTTDPEKRDNALQSALIAARQNEDRWIGLAPEFSADNEGTEQWVGTARLRRLEVERIEALLADILKSRLTWNDLQ